MRGSRILHWLCVTAIGANVAAAQGSQTGAVAARLDGTWSMVRRTWTIGDSTLYPAATYAEPGQLIVAGGYYSLMYVFTDAPRALLPTDRDPTDSELARAFNAFYATGGKLERTDSTLTMFIDIAKNPGRSGAPVRQRWQLRGDTLLLIRADQVSSPDPATARPVTRTTYYIRLP